jgi:hypothetical protein
VSEEVSQLLTAMRCLGEHYKPKLVYNVVQGDDQLLTVQEHEVNGYDIEIFLNNAKVLKLPNPVDKNLPPVR